MDFNFNIFFSMYLGTPGIKKEGDLSTNGTCAIFHHLDLGGGHFENTILVEESERERKNIRGK